MPMSAGVSRSLIASIASEPFYIKIPIVFHQIEQEARHPLGGRRNATPCLGFGWSGALAY